VGGQFTTLGGQTCYYLGRLNADGTLDSGFNPRTGNWVVSMAVQTDGKILVGGDFTTLGGLTRNSIGRLSNTAPATQSLTFDGSTITWLRGGTSPEAWRTTFDLSTDGLTWTNLGAGTRRAGGWQLAVASSPPSGVIRGRSYITGGIYNGSGWFVETQILYPNPQVNLQVTPSAGANGSINPNTMQTVNSGGSVSFTANPNLGYVVDQWLVDGSVVQTGGTGYTLSNIQANHSVQVTFTYGPLALTPVITSLEPSQVNPGGASFVLNVNGYNFVEGSVICWNGTNQNTVFNSSNSLMAIINKTLIAFPGSVSITVVNLGLGGSATSQVATLTVNLPLTITRQPQGGTVNSGQDFTLVVEAVGAPPLVYQWYKNAVAIPTATNSSFIIHNAYFGDTGNYTVIVSNSYGSQTSQVATLTVKAVPNFVLKDLTPGGGIVMPAPFQSSFEPNSFVTLTAIPANGWTFLDWKGNTQGTNPVVTLQVTYAKTLRARFGTPISVTPSGSGTVRLIPSSAFYPYGTPVRIVAEPQPGHYFMGWSGSADGDANPLTMIVRDANPAVFASFAALPAGRVALAVIPDGYGGVLVLPRDNTFTIGQTVTNKATPDDGQEFLGWGGDATGTNNPLVVTMNQSKVITASFTKRPRLDLQPLNMDGLLLSLTGEFSGSYRILSSTNLVNWGPYLTLTNAYGEAQIIEPASTNQSRFYQAVQTNITTNAANIIASGLNYPENLRLDGSYVYFADNSANDGILKRVLKGGGSVFTLAIGLATWERIGLNSFAVRGGTIYGDYGGYNALNIFAVPSAGGSASTLVSPTGGGFIGVSGSLVYFSSDFNYINSIPTSGGNPTHLAANIMVRTSAMDSSAIYFVEYYGKDVKKCSLPSGAVTTLIGGNSSEGDLIIDAANVYFSLAGNIRKVAKRRNSDYVGFQRQRPRLCLR
jgi:hypothetical protein